MKILNLFLFHRLDTEFDFLNDLLIEILGTVKSVIVNFLNSSDIFFLTVYKCQDQL